MIRWLGKNLHSSTAPQQFMLSDMQNACPYFPTVSLITWAVRFLVKYRHLIVSCNGNILLYMNRIVLEYTKGKLKNVLIVLLMF